MFRHFLEFELRYFLKGWMVWIFLIVIGAMVFGAASSDSVRLGGAIGNTHRNAPYVIQNFYAIASVLTLLMTTAFANNASIRDFQHNTHQMIFSLPVNRWHFILGRFWGATLVAMIPALGVSAGVILAQFMPWVDHERFGPVYLTAHLNGFLSFVVPNTIFVACILFPVGLYFRNTTVSFLAALGFLVASSVASAFTTDLKSEVLAALLDPYGAEAYSYMTKYWTPAERNTRSLPLSGLLLMNRLIWLAIGAAGFLFVSSRISLGEKAARRRKPAPQEVRDTPATASASLQPTWRGNPRVAQFTGSFLLECRSLIKTPAFIVILAAALLNVTTSLVFSVRESFGNSTFPVTYQVTEIIQGTLYIFLIAIITYFGGQLIWRERDDRMDEILDSLPTPEWLLYAAKFAALVVVVVLILGVAVLDGVLVQAFNGYTRFQLPVYGWQIFVRDLTSMLFLCVAAFLAHILAPNKYAGYFVYIVFLIANAFLWNSLDVAVRMVDYGSRPSLPYSEFFAFLPGAAGWWWFTLYWTLFATLLVVASVLLYQRGKDTAWHHRIGVAKLRFAGGLRWTAALSAAAFVLTAGWVFYNTLVLNTVVSPKEQRKRQADYEKLYKRHKGEPQPRVTAVRYHIDLAPETRDVVFRAEQQIVNRHASPIDRIYINLAPDYETSLSLPGAALEKDDKRLKFQIYRLSPPLAAGETRTMKFEVRSNSRGFSNGVPRPQLVQNGTFFNNGIAPQIGYDEGRELSDRNERRKQGLKEKDLMQALERNCTVNCMNTYISNNSDWVSVETVIGTAPGQIAVAPGSLVREWRDGGRHYFHYRLDRDSLNFYSFISARYAVKRDRWNDVNVEVYYHPEHEWNVPRMVDSIRKTLDYCSRNFGPYRHKQARIIEFPRIARFAQAFPGTMPYSEAIGFIADLRDKENIDHVFYVVAHEMGHQWWAHQVIGADMQGATLLSETLAQYTALMVMEREYGRDMMRKFLEYEMDRYLSSRGREALKERPLLKVEASQGYIHYNKGSLVLYSLKEMIGEDTVNQVLRELVDKFGYAGPPYPTAHELVDRLRAKTPPQYQSLIRDLFEEITLFSNRTLTASARKMPDGRFAVTINTESKKFKADEKGAEREVPIADWIEVGAFAKPGKGKKYGRTLHRERVLVKQPANTYTFHIKEAPDKAGIDPFHLLVDRTADDNLKSVEVK